MKLSMYVNLARIVFFGLLAGLAWNGDIPWYIPVGWVLYSIDAYVLIPLPFTQKWAQRRYEKQIQALIEQQTAAQVQYSGPSDPKKWS